MNRELTQQEKDIYEKSMVRLGQELRDLDLLIRSQTLTIEEVLDYNYRINKKKEEAQLEDYKAQFLEKQSAFEDCAQKLRDGFVETKEDGE